MTLEETNRLLPGDKVHWTDPDDGACSKDIVIKSCETIDDMVFIVGMDGSTLECFPEELS